MKVAVILALVACVAAQYPDAVANSRYSAPSPSISSGNGGGGYNNNQEAEYVPQTFKHVYVHVAPDEPEERKQNLIRVPGGDKHVNIIFVKTPSSNSQQETEVILPQQDEHKNLVYVLLKKGESNNNVKITRPQPSNVVPILNHSKINCENIQQIIISNAQPSKPEVNFIRYTQQQEEQQPSNEYGPPASSGVSGATPVVRDVQPPSNTYGTPF